VELLILIGLAFGAYFLFTGKQGSSSKSVRAHSRSSSQRSHSRPTTKDFKQKVIDEAIANSEVILFRYTDQDGVITSRSVSPQYLERRHEGQILCLVGHCHLRNDIRTFVVSKMESIRVDRGA